MIARRLDRDPAVADVRGHSVELPRQRVAVAAAPGLEAADELARLQGHVSDRVERGLRAVELELAQPARRRPAPPPSAPSGG